MRRIRDRIFLATKTGDPTATEAYDSIRRSIERLQVTRVDLVQLHSVGAFDDLDRRTASGRALEGAIRAREEGLVAAIGITGHGRRRCIWRRCDDSPSTRSSPRTTTASLATRSTCAISRRSSRRSARRMSDSWWSRPSPGTCGGRARIAGSPRGTSRSMSSRRSMRRWRSPSVGRRWRACAQRVTCVSFRCRSMRRNASPPSRSTRSLPPSSGCPTSNRRSCGFEGRVVPRGLEPLLDRW